MRNVLALVACILCASTVSAQDGEDWKRFPDPERFAEAIAKFEAADSLAPPDGAIVCTGSSSMRGWHRRIAADLAPLTVIPRGFGGSTYYDLLHFTDRVILAYRPRPPARATYLRDRRQTEHRPLGDVAADGRDQRPGACRL